MAPNALVASTKLAAPTSTLTTIDTTRGAATSLVAAR